MAYAAGLLFAPDSMGWTLWFRRPHGDHEILARGITSVSDIVKVPGATDADIARDHATGDAVSRQLADAFTNEPDFVVEMVPNGFVGRARLLAGLVHFDLDVSGLEHAGEEAMTGTAARARGWAGRVHAGDDLRERSLGLGWSRRLLSRGRFGQEGGGGKQGGQK